MLLPVQAAQLESALDTDAVRLRRIVRRRASVLAPQLGHEAGPLEARLTDAARDLLPSLDGAVDRVVLAARVGDELAPPQLRLEDFQNVYAAVIRSGNAIRIRDLKVRHSILLDTAANERTQAVGATSSKVLLWVTPFTAMFAALFVFTVKSSHQIRDDQVTAATESREDALRRLAEVSEADVIATGATTAFLRVPTALADDDPWSTFADECGIVVDDDGAELSSRPVPAVVLSIGAPPASAELVARDASGAPDADAVIRVVTQQTVECRDTFEGWVPAAWVSTVEPADDETAGGGSAPTGTDATDGSAPDSTDGGSTGDTQPDTTGG